MLQFPQVNSFSSNRMKHLYGSYRKIHSFDISTSSTHPAFEVIFLASHTYWSCSHIFSDKFSNLNSSRSWVVCVILFGLILHICWTISVKSDEDICDCQIKIRTDYDQSLQGHSLAQISTKCDLYFASSYIRNEKTSYNHKIH